MIDLHTLLESRACAQTKPSTDVTESLSRLANGCGLVE